MKSIGVLLVLILAVTVNSAFASHVYEHSNLHIESGWINEPVIVTERNGIEILIRDLESGKPISGLEDQLEVEVSYEGRKINLSMTEDHKNPGRYTYWIVPMLEGEYTLNISGEINGVPLSTQFALSTVEDITYKRFPGTPGPSKFIPESEREGLLADTNKVLKEEMAQLKQMVTEKEDTSSIIYVAIGLAIIGIAIGSVAVLKRR